MKPPIILAVFAPALAAVACDVRFSADGGAGTTDGGEITDSGVTDGGGFDACREFTSDELYLVESAVKNAAAALAATLDGCSLDSDCVNAPIGTGCVNGCCVAINAASEAAYREAEKGIAAEHCPKPTDGCGVPINNADCRCDESMCVAGHCVNPAAVCNPACAEDERCVSNACRSDPPPCGSEPNPDCSSALGEDECGKNGGRWQCGYFDPTFCRCDCLTSDHKCPCWKESHCEGYCMGADTAKCESTVFGFCSETRLEPYGCHCWISPFKVTTC